MAPQLVDYDQLYPGRFLKSGELLGKKPTLTIAAVEHEELADDKGPEGATKTKVVISFKETPKKLVTCKTNGLCLKAMFGRTVTDWIGKRVTIQAEVWNGKDCIRFHGSPDIDNDIDVEIALPRRRPFKKVMKAGTGANAARAGPDAVPVLRGPRQVRGPGRVAREGRGHAGRRPLVAGQRERDRRPVARRPRDVAGGREPESRLE
jgi:hypothetical protein